MLQNLTKKLSEKKQLSLTFMFILSLKRKKKQFILTNKGMVAFIRGGAYVFGYTVCIKMAIIIWLWPTMVMNI